MLIKLRPVRVFGQAVEVGEEVELRGRVLPSGAAVAFAAQVVDERLGMHLFLNVERRGPHFQRVVRRAVRAVLASPDQLRVQVGIATLVGRAHRRDVARPRHGGLLDSGDVRALVPGVGEGGDGKRCAGFAEFLGCHAIVRCFGYPVLLVKGIAFPLTNKQVKVRLKHVQTPPHLAGDFGQDFQTNQILEKGLSRWPGDAELLFQVGGGHQRTAVEQV